MLAARRAAQQRPMERISSYPSVARCLAAGLSLSSNLYVNPPTASTTIESSVVLHFPLASILSRYFPDASIGNSLRWTPKFGQVAKRESRSKIGRKQGAWQDAVVRVTYGGSLHGPDARSFVSPGFAPQLDWPDPLPGSSMTPFT